MVKNPPANAGDAGSVPGWGRAPGGGNGSSFLPAPKKWDRTEHARCRAELDTSNEVVLLSYNVSVMYDQVTIFPSVADKYEHPSVQFGSVA